MRERPGRWIALTLLLLAVPLAEAQATRSAQSDCEREAQRFGYRVLSSSNFQQLRDGWQIDLKVRDSRGSVSDGTCFVETRTGAVSLYGFGHDPGLPGNQAIEFNCASIDAKYKECQIPIDGPVRLVKTYSEARCEKGRSWGQRADRVWVDRGCRARFEVTGGSGGWTPEFDQAEQACRDKARQYGLSAIEAETPKREGSLLRLNLKGQLKGQPRTAECRYEPAPRRATVLFREFEGGQGPIAEARKACSEFARSIGLETLGAANAVWDRLEVRVPMIVQSGRESYFAYCYYDRATRRVELKQQ
jgi:hypothetical protein